MESLTTPAILAPNAGWSDYYANESFFLNYPDDARKEWNYMTEWETKKRSCHL